MGVKYNPFAGNLDIVDSPSGDFSDIDISGDLSLGTGTPTTTLQAVTPTANRTISFPDATGTVALVDGADGTIQYNEAGVLKGNGDFTVDPDWNNASTVFTGLKLNVTDTASAAGSNLVDIQSNGTSDVVIDSDGKVGIGTQSPAAPLEVVGSTNGDQFRVNQSGQYYRIGREGSGGLLEFWGSQNGYNGYIFSGANGERARIDSSGRLLVGTDSSRDNFLSGGATLQVEGVSTAASQMSLTCNTPNLNPPTFTLGKTRNNSTTAGYTPVIADDSLGRIHFAGADGTNMRVGADIAAIVNGTPGANEMPGRLVFSTNSGATGANPTERMRIDSNGIVYIRESDGTAGVYHQIDISANYRIGNHSGGSGNYVYLAPGGTSWVGVSDERLKTALVEIQDGLSKVSTLRAVTGRYTDDPETESRSFLIAQDVAAVLPEAVDAANSEQLGLRYTDTIPLLVAALKEAKEKIETLEAKVNALEGN